MRSSVPNNWSRADDRAIRVVSMGWHPDLGARVLDKDFDDRVDYSFHA